LVVELDLFRAQARRVLLEEGLSDLRECGHNGCGESRLRENVVFGVESMSLRSRITEGKKRFLGIKRSSYTRIALERDNREEVWEVCTDLSPYCVFAELNWELFTMDNQPYYALT
jgi:hypothetical protein